MEPDTKGAGLTSREVNELAKRHLVAELATRGITAALGDGSAVTITRASSEPVQLIVRAKRGPVWQTSTTYGIPRSEPQQPEGRFWVLVDLRPDVPTFWVVPEWWVQNDIHRDFSAYLARNGGRRKEGGDSTHTAITELRVAQWQDRWDLLQQEPTPAPAEAVPSESPARAPLFTTDPVATSRRLAALDAYYSAAVLNGDHFVCSSATACESSAAKPGLGFFEAQGSSVSPHYDVAEDGRATRVLVVPMETGRERSRVSIEERTAEILQLRDRPWRQWNPHMRGVGLALRLAFGRGAAEDPEGLTLPTPAGPVHVLEAYAMANLLLCSAVELATVNSRSTPVMRSNCARHLGATVDILEPSLVITQGVTVSAPFGSLVRVVEQHSPHVATCERDGRRFVWVDLKHPTYLWDWLARPYLHEVVVPAITLGRELARNLPT